MRNDLQAAIKYFEDYGKEYEPVSNNVPKYIVDDLNEQAQLYRTALTALRDMLKRQEGCWHCHGIEAHEIEYVTELKNAYLEHIKAPEAIPYRHCANCGRELSGNAEQVKEGEDETKSVEVEG